MLCATEKSMVRPIHSRVWLLVICCFWNPLQSSTTSRSCCCQAASIVGGDSSSAHHAPQQPSHASTDTSSWSYPHPNSPEQAYAHSREHGYSQQEYQYQRPMHEHENPHGTNNNRNTNEGRAASARASIDPPRMQQQQLYPQPPPQQHQQLTIAPVNLHHMALSLRYAAELNRQLYQGISRISPSLSQLEPNTSIVDGTHPTPPRTTIVTPMNENPHFQNAALQQRGGTTSSPSWDGTNGPHPVHPSTTWQPPMQSRHASADLTLFHAKVARTNSKMNRKNQSRRPTNTVRRGSLRWGPSLDLYLKHVTESLLEAAKDDHPTNQRANNDQPVIMALAMMYLDRACSVDTPRKFASSLPPCPYLAPRTVHRLVVVALILATKQVRGGTTRKHWEKLASLGIPLEQLEQMETWMTGALGDVGLYVEEGHVLEWLEAWTQTFHSSSGSRSGSRRNIYEQP